MTRSLCVVALVLLGLASPACQSGDSAAGFSSEECSEACLRIDAASCGDAGQTCVDACVHHVSVAAASDCPTEFRQYLDCFWTAEAFECDAHARTRPVGCAAQLSSYEACAGPGGAGGADAAAGGAANAGASGAANVEGGAAGAANVEAAGAAGSPD